MSYVRWMMVAGVCLWAALAMTGCAVYQAQNIEEWIKQTKTLDGSGCTYFRGNARPYADVSVLTIATWGKNAPKYLECLQNLPPDARSILP